MKRVCELVKQHPLTAFFVITLPMSWILWCFAGRYSPAIRESGVLGFRFLVSQIGEYAPAFVGMIILSLVDPIASARKRHTIGTIFVPVFALAAVMSLFTEDDILRNTPLIAAAVGVSALVVYVFSPLNRSVKTSFSPMSGGQTGTTWLVLSVLLFPVVIVVAKMLAYHPEGNEVAIIPRDGTWYEIGRYAIATFFVTLLYGGPLGEELGWRGFALPYLQKRHSPLEASVILGFFWALWHAPMDLSHAFGVPGLVGFVYRLIFTMPLTLLFTYFYNRTAGSVLVAILLHTSINFGAVLFEIQTASSFGVLFIIVSVLGCCALLSGRMWQRLPASREVCTEHAGPQE
jgi:membrane protease YdiL (CAAX protease family)